MHSDVIPVVLLAYARIEPLRRVLGCLRAERIPLLYTFADGAKGTADAASVAAVRRELRAIDWCEVRHCEREANLGLGRNVLGAVGEVAAQHAAFIVWEDDLVCAPGAYAWLSAALRHYADNPRVFSVTGWTHPTVTPSGVGSQPYFDRRAECWVWGTYARCWRDMDQSAATKMSAAQASGTEPDAYGADLPAMVEQEERRNLWAVRWLYHHFQHDALCLRPPWALVEHIGVDANATNATGDRWAAAALQAVPAVPETWPDPQENPACQGLWQRAGTPETLAQRAAARVSRVSRVGLQAARASARNVLPDWVRARWRQWRAWRWFRGDYANWAGARAASSGYESNLILDRVLSAALKVQVGEAAFERDGVLFLKPEPDAPLLHVLQRLIREAGRPIRVLDFGGSLGSIFWRLQPHLASGAIARWDVVEQPAFVVAGQQHIREPLVRFFPDIATAKAAGGTHDVLLASGVLQYIEGVPMLLADWRKVSVPRILLNNVPLHSDAPTRIRVQHVPPSIYPASYPVRFFNREEFLGWLTPDYDVVEEFASEAVWPVDGTMYPSTGLLLQRKAPTAGKV